MMLKHLNEVNNIKIYSVFDDEFRQYGNVINGLDFSFLIDFFDKNTTVPQDGNIYVASVKEAERSETAEKIKAEIYGGMPIQIGYCNGRNETYNGFEYHKCSEVNIAVTDFCLVLGHTWQIENNKFYVGNEKVFYVEKGTAIEMFQTTLHLSPCRVHDNGFKDIIVLAAETNTPLNCKAESKTCENALLLQKNKWVIAHPERMQLINQGAYAGLIGENRKINY